MWSFFTLKRIVILLLAVAVLGFGLVSYRNSKNTTPDWVTDSVTRGNVESIVSVSGAVEAENTASLAFPVSGIIAEILVKEGDTVERGAVLALLEQSGLLAERQDALSALKIAEADRAELISGRRTEERDVTDIGVAIARDNFVRVAAEEAEKVQNAYRTLLSSDLEVVPVDKSIADVPPRINGSYTCGSSGIYTMNIFRSSAQSGFSYRLSGLESGTYTGYTESPAPFGSCGLSIQFSAGTTYSNREWFIEIPNTRGLRYTENLNAYTLALQQEKNAVAAAQQALEKAEREAALENAAPRAEALARATANVEQAAARLAQVDARIEDRALRAPFSGIVSKLSAVRGESVGASPVLTMVADDTFELIIRVPEIDITKVALGQRAEVVFDARQDEVIVGNIVFIAPLATLIDGVAYFEATIAFDEPPAWLRGGLNADVDIIVERREDVLRIPKRFLIEDGGTYSVIVPAGTKTATTAVEVGFIGNDGFVEISNLGEGDTVIAP
jgi:HlyD family secretion protein